jgi:hypothetical protein
MNRDIELTENTTTNKSDTKQTNFDSTQLKITIIGAIQQYLDHIKEKYCRKDGKERATRSKSHMKQANSKKDICIMLYVILTNPHGPTLKKHVVKAIIENIHLIFFDKALSSLKNKLANEANKNFWIKQSSYQKIALISVLNEMITDNSWTNSAKEKCKDLHPKLAKYDWGDFMSNDITFIR